MRSRDQGYPVQGLGGRLMQVDRPSIPLRVIGPSRDQVVLGLLDTGADDVLLPDHVLGLLGATTRPGMRASIRGVGGRSVTADFGTMDLQVRAHRWSATVGFYPGDRVLLGHAGFLE